MEEIRFFDCFAGIGGFYQGAVAIDSEKYSFKHVAYCEIDDKAQRFYDVACSSNEIQKIGDVKEIKTNKNQTGLEVVDFDMLFAGFPCQSFSNVGYRKGFDDPRGQLFFYILDMLDYYNPKCLEFIGIGLRTPSKKESYILLRDKKRFDSKAYP